jgi:hypothetical protein
MTPSATDRGVFNRRIFRPKIDEVMGDWRKLHNELHNLHSLPIIIRITKSWKMRWAGHVARMGQRRMHVISGKSRRKEFTRKTKT